ncbi:MAG: GGDEF domain-containing protein [Fulvimarina manganoxydans]|uniref:GGDEF domain-containing protein n=1 Tax=Fulvimarina manganoxydans TaxID=937218 RepID=UPI002352AD56|nr:GGDEF domain-containing protein [Fulvimarina manganoxydans]MCK5932837.1 GGDEF domain-containing protein [Fulvimarina manganoxydans]
MTTIDALLPRAAEHFIPSAARQKQRLNGFTVETALEYLEAEGLWKEIEEPTAQRGTMLKYSGRVAAICRSVAWPENQQTAKHWLWCALTIMVLAIPFDWIAFPHALAAILLGHGPMTLAAFILALRAWRDERSELAQGLTGSLFGVCVMVAAALTGSQAGGANFERFVVLAYLGLATGLALLPLNAIWRWAYAGALNVSLIVCQFFNPLMDGIAGWLFTLYFSAFLLACVFTRYAFDFRQIEMTILRLKEARSTQLMKRMALTDALTGLPNRKAMMGDMARLLDEAQSGSQLSVAMVDIDDFKRLNDTLGHAAGDEALKSVGSVFMACANASGAICGRIGGEEFLLLFPDTDVDAATRALEEAMRHLDRLNIPNPGSRVADRVTLSVGLVTATFGDGAEPHADQLMRVADIALYESKNAGRNRITFMNPSAVDLESA